MKYTRDNLTNEVLFALKGRAILQKQDALSLSDAVDRWLLQRDENALTEILAALNEKT